MDAKDIEYTLQDAGRHIEEAKELLQAIGGQVDTAEAIKALNRAAEQIEML